MCRPAPCDRFVYSLASANKTGFATFAQESQSTPRDVGRGTRIWRGRPTTPESPAMWHGSTFLQLLLRVATLHDSDRRAIALPSIEIGIFTQNPAHHVIQRNPINRFSFFKHVTLGAP